MSTVLEKPVLLDETGQLIVDKLDDIKEAIGNSGEYVPVAIRITTQPTKVSYYEGDALDISGIVVSLVGADGSLIDVTSVCTFSPLNGAILSTTDSSITVTYHYGKDNIDFRTSQPITVNAVVPVSIAVTTPPTKTEYMMGDALDLSGIVITATLNNGATSNVTNQCSFSPANGATLGINDNVITITYQNLTTTQNIDIIGIFGAEWDGTATSVWTRTDGAANFTDPVPAVDNGDGSSPFDNIMPWSGMQLIQDETVGHLVSIPKFYYKWTRDGVKMKLQISSTEQQGFFVSPAHADRGDGEGERDIVYVAAYKYAGFGGTYSSAPGVSPQAGWSRSTFRSYIHNLASDVWQYDFAMYWTIMMLYLVEYADWNIQSKIGVGGNSTNNVELNGKTANMIYHTGTDAEDRASRGHVRYRYIEDLWTNNRDWVDGIYFDSSRNAYCIKNPADFSDSTGGTNVGTVVQSTYEIKSWSEPSASGFEYALVPASGQSNNNYDTYICDQVVSQSGDALTVGGVYGITYHYGAFYFEIGDSNNGSGHCSRLMKLPTNS